MYRSRIFVTALALLAFCAFHRSSFAALDAAVIESASGSPATTTPDGVVRLSYPRKEVELTVDGTRIVPFAGLTSWAAFIETPHGAMLMGDTVAFEDEITPAMDAAFAAGLEVTALHNHFIYDKPKVYFMHVGGSGAPADLAKGVRAVWDAIKSVRAASPTPAAGFGGNPISAGTIDAAPLDEIIGAKSAVDSGMVKFTIGREGEMHGVKIGASMGLTTWAAFTGTDEWAAVDGDVIMTADEVQTVLRALRKANIQVVAIHNHMIGETPAFYFVHFWSKGKAAELAQGFKTVLDAQAGVHKPGA